MTRRPAATFVALLAVQALVGYEWVVSGLTKVVRADFPSGLHADLVERIKAAPSWYASFAKSVVVPHSVAFGYAIELAELLAGFALVAGALTLLRGRLRDSVRLQRLAYGATTAAALAGLFLTLNFALANGSSLGRPIAPGSFDEGVDLDTLLSALQAVLVIINAAAFLRLQQSRVVTRSYRPLRRSATP